MRQYTWRAAGTGAVLLFTMLGASSAVADEESVNSAYRLCALIDASGTASQPCDVSGWGSSVNAWFDISGGEARKLCSQIAGLARNQGWRFQPGWTLKIFSPYSGNNTIAFCQL